MLRILAAFAWLRLRLLLNSLKGTRRRDGLERLSRASEVIGPILFLVLLVPGSLLIGLLGFLAGWKMGSDNAPDAVVLLVARVMLLVVTFAVLLAPLVRTVNGVNLNVSRLILLPIPYSLLHLTEVVTGLADPWLAGIVPALLLLPAGLVVSGAVRAGAVALVAGIVLAGTLASLAALAGIILQLLFRDRRRAEMLSLLFIALATIVGVAGSTFTSRKEKNLVEGHRKVERKVVVPRWMDSLPPGLYARSIERACEGNLPASLLPLGGLALTGGLLFGLSRVGYGFLLDTPEGGARRRVAREIRVGGMKLPGLSPGAAAVAAAEIRAVLRTVRGKAGIYFTPVGLLAAGFAMKATFWSRGAHGGPSEATSFILLPIGVLFSLMALQPILANQFASDGPGLTLQLLAPLTDREIVMGKTVGCGLLTIASDAIFLFPACFLVPSRFLVWLPAVILGGVSVYLLVAPVCALLSAFLPKTADLGRMGKAGNPHPIAAFAATFATVAAAVPPCAGAGVGLLLFPADVTRAALVGLALVAVWTGISVAISILLMRLAAGALGRRRENLAMVAQGR